MNNNDASKNSLLILIRSLNAVVDRLDTLVDRLGNQIAANDEVFSKMREEYLKKIIEASIKKEQMKQKTIPHKGINFGNDIVRKVKRS